MIHDGLEHTCYTDNEDDTGESYHSLQLNYVNKTDLGIYVAKAESIIGIAELKFILRGKNLYLVVHATYSKYSDIGSDFS